jgi:cysteine desulfurase family protein (TIGR01976 family)
VRRDVPLAAIHFEARESIVTDIHQPGHAYDVDAVRAQFPALRAGAAHFDGPGGTQTPQPVIDAIANALSSPLSNRAALTLGERNADAIVSATRQSLGDLLGTSADGIVFGRSATQINYDFSRSLSRSWGPGDEIVVTRLDHDSNIRPWVQAAEHLGATVRWAGFDPVTSELLPSHIGAVLSDRTRLVAVTAASNLIGTRPDVTAISRLAHDVGALVYVDAVHEAAHNFVDLAALGADFVVCSPYKFLGPHFGVLASRRELLETIEPDKLLPSTNQVPERFEFGTLPYEFLAGAGAAIDFIAGLAPTQSGDRRTDLRAAFTAIGHHEHLLLAHLESGLAAMRDVTVYTRAENRTPTILLTIEGRETADAYRYLAGRDVDAPSGSFYALEASRWLGLGDEGGLRVGLAPYSNADDVDRLLGGLDDFITTTT